MSEYKLVLTTVASKELSDKLSVALLGLKLCVCVSVNFVESSFIWNQKIHKKNEYFLCIKTKSSYIEKTIEHITLLHSYDVPEILVISIEQGSKAYLKWIDNTLDR